MYITDNLWTQLSNDPTKFGELLIDYGKTKDELKETKAKNDILMHTEKTYTVTEIAKEPEISNTKPDYGTCTLFSSYRQDILSHHGTFLINLIRVNLSNFPEGDQDGVCSL